MQFPRWLKLLYWGALFVGATFVLGYRYSDGDPRFPTAVDTAFALFWVAMAFVPLFSEFSVGAFSVKQEVQELKSEVKEQIHTLRADFLLVSQVQNQLHQQVSFQMAPAPPPDAQLPAIEARIREVIREEMGAREEGAALRTPIQEVPADVREVFAARYALERELRRLGRGWVGGEGRFMPAGQIARRLAQWYAISPQMADSVRELYSVCSPAVHGERPTPEQVAFVRDVAPPLIAALQTLEQREADKRTSAPGVAG